MFAQTHIRRVVDVLTLSLVGLMLLGASDSSRFDRIGHKLMCTCGCNQVLLECNHVGCSTSDRMRSELATAAERSDSDDLLLQSFVQQYGPTVLLAPTGTGFDRTAWTVPYVALALGLVMVGALVRGWKKDRVLAVPIRDPGLKVFRAQVEDETQL